MWPGWGTAFPTLPPLATQLLLRLPGPAPSFILLLTEAHPVKLEPAHPPAPRSVTHLSWCWSAVFYSKALVLSFWIPGFIYSSRNMYLHALLVPLMDLLWRITVGLPSKILNEAKLLLLHFLKSKYRTALQQLTLHSVHYRASKSARDSPKEKQISSSQKHFRPSCFWWEGHNSTILRTHWARSNQEQFVNSLLEQLHSWRPISSWYKTFG